MNYEQKLEKNEKFKEEELSEILNLLKKNEERIKVKDKLTRDWVINKIKNERKENKHNIFFSFLCLVIGLIFLYLFFVFFSESEHSSDFLISLVTFLLSLVFLFFPAKNFYYFIFCHLKEKEINLSDEDIAKYLLDLKYKKSS